MSTLALDVELASKGDRLAFSRLIQATQNVVSSVALATVNDVSASEDIAQEVFVHAWRGLGQLRSVSSFLPWLRQLTRNRAQQFLRERHRGAKVGALVGDDALAQVVDDQANAEGALLDAQQRRVLATALEALPDGSREVLILYYREGQSVTQVAQLLELSEEATKKRLSRAREALRDAVTEQELGGWLEQSAPGANFSAAVLAMLPAAPVAGGAGASALLKLGAPVSLAWASLVGGPVLGLFGMWWGHKRELKKGYDEAERKTLTKVRNVELAMMVAYGLTSVVSVAVGHPGWLVVGGLVFAPSCLSYEAVVGWPVRVSRMRREAAAGNTAKHRAETRSYWLGWGLGAFFGIGTLVWAGAMLLQR